MDKRACAITGHRPSKFRFHNEEEDLCKSIKEQMKYQFETMYQHHIRRFYIGCAQGTDTWAGEILLQQKKEEEFSEIEIVAVIPFPDYDK